MKKYMLWIALAAFLIPILARGLWFYRGIPARPAISTPDYSALAVKQPPYETPKAEDTKIKQTKGIVLLDGAHGNQYQQSEILTLRESIEKRGGNLETVTDVPSLANRLKYASAYVVISPSVSFSADEARIIKAFVERGGRVIVFTDATRGLVYTDFFTGSTINYSDANAANSLLAQFGITVNNDYLYDVTINDSNFRNIFFEEFGKHELTFGLKKVAFYGTHSLKTTEGTLLFESAESTLSSIDDVHDPNEGGAALSVDGNVLALGDLTFLTSPYHSAADNADLIDNIADFMLNGKRMLTLSNYPFIFTGTEVQIYPSSEVILSAETVDAISRLQSTLNGMNVSLSLAKESPREGNAVILGTFAPNEDMERFLEPFNIELDGQSEFIELPKLGKVGRYGNGILLLEKTKTGTRLTLLADTASDLVSLINTLAGGSLNNCVLQDDIGICSVGYGGTYSNGKSEPTPEPLPTEFVPTPTAGG